MAKRLTNTNKTFTLNQGILFQGDYRKTLDSVRGVRLILTSPPYNIGTAGVRVDGLRKFGKFDLKSFSGINSYKDDLPEDVYQAQQKDFLLWSLSKLTPDGVIAYVHKNRHKKKRMITPYEWILPLVTANKIKIYEEIVWDRGSTHNHDKNYLYPESERIYILCNPKARPFFKNFDPDGKHKGMSDVWQISRARSSNHDAAFPVSLAERLILCYSKPGEVVMDPYSGSGTCFLAAIKHKRKFIGSELSILHFENACKRIQTFLES